MKVKFDLKEDVRLKAYYLLQLLKISGEKNGLSFELWLSKVACESFETYLDTKIDLFEKNIALGGTYEA